MGLQHCNEVPSEARRAQLRRGSQPYADQQSGKRQRVTLTPGPRHQRSSQADRLLVESNRLLVEASAAVSRRPPQDGAMQSFYASSWATTAGGGSASSSRRSSRELQPLHSNSGVSQPVAAAAASAAAQQPALQKAGHRQPEFFFIGDDTEDDPSISDADMPEAVSTEKENPGQCGSTVVYFHNVPFGIEEAALLPLFQTVGQLKSLRVFRQRNDRATGQGLCEFTSHDAAVRALRILHGNPIEDVSGTGARALQLRLHDENRTPAGGLDEKGREEERPRRAKPGGFRLRAGGGKLRSKPAEPGVEKQAQHGRQNPTIDQLDQLRLAWQRVEGDLADVSGGRQMLGGEKKHTGTVSSFSYAKLRSELALPASSNTSSSLHRGSNPPRRRWQK